MHFYKNKSLTVLAFASIVFSATLVKSNPLTIGNTTSQILFDSSHNTVNNSLIIDQDALVNVNGASAIGINSISLTSITNNGTISSNNNGISFNNSTIGTIDNLGTINVSGANGIEAGSSNIGIITNSGTISGTNNAISAVVLPSSNSEIKINNTGSLNSQKAINLNRRDIVINNSASGTISGTTHGVLAYSDNFTLNNSASITSSSRGIQVFSENTQINNSGSGTISGTLIGLSIVGDNNDPNTIINNSAKISGGSNGIYTSDTNTIINNSGNISATNFGGVAIVNDAGIGSINNTGSIISNGKGIDIRIVGGNEIINSGLISASTKAIDFGGTSNNHLILNPGSTINGEIDFGNGTGNNVTVNGNGMQATRDYYYRGNFTLNPYSDDLLVLMTQKNNKPVFIVSYKPELINQPNLVIDATGDINNVVSERLITFRSQPIPSPNSDKINSQPISYWSEAFGSYQEKSSYKSIGDSESTAGGIIFGADKKIDANKIVGGFVGGLSGSNKIMNRYNSRIAADIDSSGLFAGSYLSTNLKSYFVDLSLTLGLIENNSQRYSGGEVASSSYNNIFVDPAITIGKILTLPIVNLPVITSATLRYTGQWLEGTNETGSSFNIKTNNQYLDSVGTRLKIETNNKRSNIGNGKYIFNVRTGIDAYRMISNQNTNVTIFGQNISLISNNRKYNVDGFVGLNASYLLKEDVRFYADIETTKGISKSLSNNDLGLFGRLGLKYQF